MKEMACAICCLCFFRQLLIMWFGFPQYKVFFGAHQCCFSYFVSGLNCVLSICIGSSFGVDTTCYNHMGGHEISLY
jgi:hypothetical protein